MGIGIFTINTIFNRDRKVKLGVIKLKIGAVIVTYNPNIEIFERNVSSVINQVNNIVIVDNGSSNFKEIEESMFAYEKVILIELQHNFGIAKAQNDGFYELKHRGCKWVLTLDQDTVLPTNYVERITKYITKYNKKVGIITGAYIDRNWNTSYLKEVRQNRDKEVEEFTQEISSGNLVAMSAWETVGGFDEYLFIDYVDFDFDYRLKNAGYVLYRANQVEFDHEIGSPIKHNFLTKILLLDRKELFDHSCKRLFYLNRNRIIVRKRYPQFGSSFKMMIAEILDLRKVLVMKGSKIKKFSNSLLGIVSGILHKD